MKKYKPNHIPPGQRIINITASLMLLGYGTVGLLNDDIYIPGRTRLLGRDVPGMHLHGLSAWLMYLAFLLAVMNLISVVVDHYDRRDNQQGYKQFARNTLIAALVTFILAVFSDGA